MKRTNNSRLTVQTLEARDLMAGIVFDSVSGTVTIHGSNSADEAKVAIVNNQVKVDLTSYAEVAPYLSFFNESKTFAPNAVKQIKFFGNDGNDRFTNTTSINTQADGGLGNDTLIGGSGADFLTGNYGDDQLLGNGGNDTLWGSGGHDSIDGGAGHDIIKGHGGHDNIDAGSGNDQIFGGSGNDHVYGNSGADLIVLIGGDKDTAVGGTGIDTFWVDSTDTVSYAEATETAKGYVNKVSSFYGYTFDGGVTKTTISKELEGQNLLDPLADDGVFFTNNYANNPLFAANGPTADDVFQGAVGDCYFMARLSAVADQNPEVIKKMIVALGDGTFAVRFMRGTTAEYVRVDADLYVNPLNNTPIYAKLGRENSLWVPMIEKAYAFWRKNQGTYASINGGNGGFQGTSADLGVTQKTKDQNSPVTAQQVIDWDKNGRANNTTKSQINAAAIDLLKWMRSELANGNAVVVGGRSSLSNTLAMQLDDSTTEADESTWRRSQHIFMVDRITTDANGNVTGLVVRNPYGTQGPNGDGYITITDLARVYFCLGGAVSLQVK